MDHRIASNSASVFFAHLRSAGNATVASTLGCSESTVSELSAKDRYKFNFNTMPELLARLGLKIVPCENKCYRPEDIEHLLYMARKGMESITADSLEWGDE